MIIIFELFFFKGKWRSLPALVKHAGLSSVTVVKTRVALPKGQMPSVPAYCFVEFILWIMDGCCLSKCGDNCHIRKLSSSERKKKKKKIFLPRSAVRDGVFGQDGFIGRALKQIPA